MCWNAPVSLITFIAGCITCIIIGIVSYKQRKYELMALSFGWIWVICMQLWEYFIWKNPNHQNMFKMAYLFNITQVILLGLIYLCFFKNQGTINRCIAFIILLFYTCYFLYQKQDRYINVKNDSGHLDYKWWNKSSYSSMVYLISLILIFLVLVRPFRWSVMTITYIILLLLLSKLFYSNSVASMWCFFAVSVPIMSYVFSLI